MNREQLRTEEQEVAQRRQQDEEEIRDDKQQLDERELESFGAVTRCMCEILDQHPDFEPPEWLPTEESEALRLLYEAKVGEREEIGDGHISGIVRMRALNLALATLRPVLSLGLGPGHEAMEGYDELTEKVAELRLELKQTIYKEGVGRRKKKPEKDEEDDGADEDDPDDGDDAELEK